MFDVLHLGVGPDGHCASLFPNHPLLDATGAAAGVHDSPKPPPERITLTLPTLNASRRILMIVTGAEKADAVARILAGPDRATPSSLIDRWQGRTDRRRRRADRVRWLTSGCCATPRRSGRSTVVTPAAPISR